jgi:hydroxyacid-oxoacid transhydrogenase
LEIPIPHSPHFAISLLPVLYHNNTSLSSRQLLIFKMTSIRVVPSAANRALNLLRTVQYTHPPSCPCHSNPNHHHHLQSNHVRRLATPVDPSRQKEYAFEMAASSIRFGPGATREVGMDFANMKAKRVCIVTDQNVAKLDAMKQAVEGLSKEGIEFTVYDKVRVEPKDSS